jgi:hypothetical protein
LEMNTVITEHTRLKSYTQTHMQTNFGATIPALLLLLLLLK